MKTAGFVSELSKLLTASRQTLALAESCTGGTIGQMISSRPGSSAYFLGGVVAYHNHIKRALLGIPNGILKRRGAVSAPVARAMAENIRLRFKADFAASTTGIAGPAGGTAKKPVGLVWIAVADRRGCQARRYVFEGSRSRIRRLAALEAISLLSASVRAQNIPKPRSVCKIKKT
ncbi:MAG: nicotinamide-nucleotide amidohydrolase family protein [Candidatus Omnitrophica bacterium]|nr:nicotinamide-nucleotide amidohydrolase family protein [Candidatus Omnitrophota bacterium]